MPDLTVESAIRLMRASATTPDPSAMQRRRHRRAGRTRSWLALLAVVGTVVGAAPAAARPSRAASPDWRSLSVTGHVKDTRVPLRVTARFEGGAPTAVGFVFAGDLFGQGRPQRFSALYRGGGGVGATARAAGATYSLTVTQKTPSTIELTGYLTAFAGRSLSLLVLAPGGVVAVTAPAPHSVTVRTLSGTGSRLLRVGEGAAGVGAVSVSVGATLLTRAVPTGVVGVFGLLCALCYDDWVKPGGHQHQRLNYLVDVTSFAGGPGRWSWTWAGAALGEGPLLSTTDPVAPDGVVGAYAPVPDWQQYVADGD